MPLTKCPRCEKIFNKPENSQYPVCNACIDDEQRDYEKIRKILEEYGNINATEISEKAEIPLDVILRMCDQGWFETETQADSIYCGRCGAPAISATKRLCEACLIQLQRECLKAINELRQTLKEKAMRNKLDVMRAVEEKKQNIKTKRTQIQVSKTKIIKTSPEKSTGRMVYQEKINSTKQKNT
ncbi:MAG: hypothetical protein ACP5UA_02400 [Candidatus Hydrogenedens sp.]